MWPHEAPALKPLRKQTPPIPAPPENLYPIARASPKQKEVAAEGILRKLGLYECCKSIKAFAHVGRAGGEPHVGVRRQCNHRRTRRAITRASTFVSMRPCTTMPWPFASWISMASQSGLDRRLWAGTSTTARSVGSTVGVLTFTGSIGGLVGGALGSSNPCRYICRQANTWFGFTSWRRATVATEAPSTCVSFTIRSFSSIVCCRRGPVRRPSESVEILSWVVVST